MVSRCACAGYRAERGQLGAGANAIAWRFPRFAYTLRDEMGADRSAGYGSNKCFWGQLERAVYLLQPLRYWMAAATSLPYKRSPWCHSVGHVYHPCVRSSSEGTADGVLFLRSGKNSAHGRVRTWSALHRVLFWGCPVGSNKRIRPATLSHTVVARGGLTTNGADARWLQFARGAFVALSGRYERPLRKAVGRGLGKVA